MSDIDTLLASISQQLRQLSADMADIKQTIAPAQISTGWVYPDEAAIALASEGIRNARHLNQLRREGAFSELRKEIRNVGKGRVPRWQYHVENCRKRVKVAITQGA